MTKLQNVKFIKILKNLDKNTLLDFERFLNSSYFLERKDLPKLFKEIKKYYPDFNLKDFNKRDLFMKAFPEKNYSDILLRKYFSELHKMLMLYFPAASLKNKDLKSEIRAAEVYYEHGNLDDAEKSIISTIKKYKAQKTKDPLYHYDMYFSEELLFCIYQKKDNIKNELMLHSISEHFVKYSVMNLFKVYTIVSSYDVPFYYPSIMDKVIEIAEGEELKDDPVIKIYYYCFKLASEPNNHGHYYALKELVFKNESLLPHLEFSNIYQSLNNYCSSRIDLGIVEFYREKFELNKEIIKIEFRGKGILNINYFIGIITSALIVNEVRWAEKLLKQYKNRLSNDNKEDRMNYVMAYLEMYKKNYAKALEFISKINFSDYSEKIKVKSITMMLHYESGAYESVLYLADAYKHYLSKHKNIIPKELKERTNNFINAATQLAKYKLSNAKKSSADILIKKPAANYIWLFNKVQELESKHK